MQFERTHKVGTDYSTVKFYPHNVKGTALLSIIDTLMKIGGKMGETVSDWTFPILTTSYTINQVIRNTCFVCGGLMQDGIAFDNTHVSFDDFGGDAGEKGTTQSKCGNAKLLTVRKCTVCGHSHT